VEYHHLTYERVGGDELPTDLLPICRTCHQMIHVLERRGDIGLDPRDMYDEERALAYQATLALQRERRDLMREQFHELPLSTRLHRLAVAYNEHGAWWLKRDLRTIVKMLDKAERKCALGDEPMPEERVANIDGRLRAVESSLTDERPDALDDLVRDLPKAA